MTQRKSERHMTSSSARRNDLEAIADERLSRHYHLMAQAGMIDHWANAVLVSVRLGLAEQAGYDARIMARLALAYLKRSVKT